jgi:uncharacterized protein (UPF0276 family)
LNCRFAALAARCLNARAPACGIAKPLTKFAANYCPEAAHLLGAGRASFDLFKCPAWPDLIATARELVPVYVHFPLAVGWGAGTAIDSETGTPAAWDRIASQLSATGTPLVNLHLAPPAVLCANRDAGGSAGPIGLGAVERLIVDVAGVVDRVGSSRVVLENDYESIGATVNPALRPETFHAVLNATDAGLLLDLAHAQLAARRLGVDPREYIESLPVSRLRELHVSGAQHLKPAWAGMLRAGGVDADAIDRFLERSVDGMCDHLPLTPDDWALTEWALERIRVGAWPRPWVVSLEYGGVGPWFASVTTESVLAHHLPRLAELLRRV